MKAGDIVEAACRIEGWDCKKGEEIRIMDVRGQAPYQVADVVHVESGRTLTNVALPMLREKAR